MVLQQAFDSSFGIAVRVESFGKDLTSISLRGKGIIYAVREDYPHFKILQIKLSPDNPETELWLIKDPTRDSEPSSPAPEPRKLEW